MQNRITKFAQCVFFLVISSCSVNETVEPNVMALEFSHDKILPTMSEYVDSVSYLNSSLVLYFLRHGADAVE